MRFVCECGHPNDGADLGTWYEFHPNEIWHETCAGCGQDTVFAMVGRRERFTREDVEFLRPNG